MIKNATPQKAPGCEFAIDSVRVVARSQPGPNGQNSVSFNVVVLASDNKVFGIPRPEQMTEEEGLAFQQAAKAAFEAKAAAEKTAADTFQASIDTAMLPFLGRAYGVTKA